jgi:hypothetical protein
MSTINVNAIDKESGSTLTLGGLGTTVAVHASATTSGFDSGLASVQTFTSSGTWTKTSGITKVIVEVQGAGGGGGGVKNGGSSQGGGGGGYAKKFIDVSSISTATITIGSGGTAGYGSAHGGVGGDSIWSDGTNTVTGGGGIGGSNPPNGTTLIGGVDNGGTHSGGDWGITGGRGNGHTGQYKQFGGGTFFAPHNFNLGVANHQTPGNSFGQGGCGTYRASTTGSSSAGFQGVVIVTEYK